MENEVIKIDGAFGQGGGQILRTACSLSAATGKPCTVFNIRKNKPNPGLATQHLLGLRTLAQICSATLDGDKIGSQEVFFNPGIIPETLAPATVKIETAGSISLLLQTLTPLGLIIPSPVKIIFDGGATDTFFSPTIDYFQYVFLKFLEKFGGKAEISIKRRGYYPEGGASVETTIYPFKLKTIKVIERNNLQKIAIFSGASESLKDKKVAERQLAGTREVFGALKLPVQESLDYYQTQCPGSHICLSAIFENTVMGTDNLGKLGKRAEDVGKEAALGLLKEEKSGACLDKHMSDQILLYMALSKGKSAVTVSEITEHCKTNMQVIEKFLPGKFQVKENIISWNLL